MPEYFNRNDREHHVAMLVMWDYLEQWIEQSHRLNKEEKKWLKSARTYTLKASNSLIARMDKQYAEKLIRSIKSSNISIVDKQNTALRDRADHVYVAEDDLYDLAELALSECVGCKRKDYQKCKWYQLFFQLNIPPSQEETEGCPFEN